MLREYARQSKGSNNSTTVHYTQVPSHLNLRSALPLQFFREDALEHAGRCTARYKRTSPSKSL
jgi:hypothetical protein